MKHTKLEKHLLKKSFFLILSKGFLVLLILFLHSQMRFIYAIPAYLIFFFTTFPICENGYIPSYHYFFRYRWKHSYQERLELSNQCEDYKYIRIGEGVFTEEYLIFYDFGAILHYSEIKTISFSKVRNLNVVTARLKNGKKYSFNIALSEYLGDSSSYQKAIDRFNQFNSSKDNFDI